jgi:hypothetical protein
MRFFAALSLLALPLLPAVGTAQAHPRLLMISIDGMRPDYVTRADEHHLKVPNLRRFMAEGTYAGGVVGVFPTVTLPSHTTMVTGVWPAQHGVYANTIFNPTNEEPEQHLKNPEAKSAHPKIDSWDAAVWESGGSAAIMLREPNDKALYKRVYEVLRKAQANPSLGIKRIVTLDEFIKSGRNPDASFMVDFKLGFRSGRHYTGGLTTPAPGTGTHGYLPDQEPQVRSSFFALGVHIDRHKDLGVIDMRQIAPTVAKLLNVSLPAAKQQPLAIER